MSQPLPPPPPPGSAASAASRARFHLVALVVSGVGLLVVVALGVAAAVIDGRSGAKGAGGGSSPGPAAVASRAPASASASSSVVVVPGGWRRIDVDGASYAVPPGWRARPARERAAYREEGRIVASGRGAAQSWANDCRTDFAPIPVAWAILADPVDSSNPAGVAEASAAAWARGYAADSTGRPRRAGAAAPLALAGGGTAMASSITVDLTGSANPCNGDSAELTAVAVQRGDRVVTLVVARYLEVEGAPSDAEYAAVLASLRQS